MTSPERVAEMSRKNEGTNGAPQASTGQMLDILSHIITKDHSNNIRCIAGKKMLASIKGVLLQHRYTTTLFLWT